MALDLKTLSDAAKSVGANWPRTLWHVVLPNLRTAILAAAFLTIAIVLGEYTISSLLLFNTFAVYIQHIGKSQAYPAAALAILSFAFTWFAMLALFVLTRGRGRPTRNRSSEMSASVDLRLSGLYKRFGETAAVEGVDLDVGPGEFISLLGPER